MLHEVAQSQVNTQQSIEASRLSIEKICQLVVSNARATEANSNAIAELRASQQDFLASIEDVVGMVGTIAEYVREGKPTLEPVLLIYHGNTQTDALLDHWEQLAAEIQPSTSVHLCSGLPFAA